MTGPLTAADPTRIGPYAVAGRLGAGGMGAVYLGRAPDGTLCALKVIHPGLAREREFRSRFAREVAAARRVSGPHLARVRDADLDASPPWLATEYVAGPSLDALVAAAGPLSVPRVRDLARELFTALASVHAAGVVHRDVKPTNVLVGPDGAVLIDFGIAHAAESTRITRTGMVIGSPGFMSPEQAAGHAVGPASDVFSLAAVLLFAATGTGPFGVGSPAALLLRAADTPPRLADLPDELRPLLGPCLTRDPATRPTAADLVGHGIGDGPPNTTVVHGRPTGTVNRASGVRREWWLLAGGATAVAVLVVVLLVLTAGAPVPGPAPTPPERPPQLGATTVTLPGTVSDVAFSPDGRRAWIGRRGGLDVLDTVTNQVTTTVRTSGDPTAVAAAPDGSGVLVASQGAVQVLDTASYRVVREIAVGAYTSGLAVVSDGRRLVALTEQFDTPEQQKEIAVLDLATGRAEHTVPLDLDGVVTLAPSGDGGTVFVAGDHGVVAIGAADGAVRSRTTVDSPYLATAPGDGVVMSSWNAPALRRLGSDGRTGVLPVPGSRRTSYGAPNEYARAMAGSTDGRRLFVARDADGGGTWIETTETASGRVTARSLVPGGVARSTAELRLSPDGRRVVMFVQLNETIAVVDAGAT